MGVLSAAAGAVLGGLARGVGGLFTTTRTSTADDGTETEVRKVRPFRTSLAGLLVFLLLYHLLIWPWLNYHFPEYGFPPLDLSLLSTLVGLGM